MSASSSAARQPGAIFWGTVDFVRKGKAVIGRMYVKRMMDNVRRGARTMGEQALVRENIYQSEGKEKTVEVGNEPF